MNSELQKLKALYFDFYENLTNSFWSIKEEKKYHQIVVLVDLFKLFKRGAASITCYQDTGARIFVD